jgi:hypothetical protein
VVLGEGDEIATDGGAAPDVRAGGTEVAVDVDDALAVIADVGGAAMRERNCDVDGNELGNGVALAGWPVNGICGDGGPDPDEPNALTDDGVRDNGGPSNTDTNDDTVPGTIGAVATVDGDDVGAVGSTSSASVRNAINDLAFSVSLMAGFFAIVAHFGGWRFTSARAPYARGSSRVFIRNVADPLMVDDETA